MSQATILHSIAAVGDLKVLDTSQLVHAAQQNAGTRLEAGESPNDAPAQQSLRLFELSIALHRVFNAEQDRIVWEIDPDRDSEQAPQLRFDGPHWQIAPAADPPAQSQSRLAEAIGMAVGYGKMSRQQWVVAITAEDALPSEEVLAQLNLLHAAQARFLWIVCQSQTSHTELGQAERSQTSRRTWARLARAARMQSTGPVSGNDLATLIATIDRLKQSQQPAILHLQMRDQQPATTEAAFATPTLPGLPADTQADSYVALAGSQLAALADHDARVVGVSLLKSRLFQNDWSDKLERTYQIEEASEHVLAWCAGLAATGCRPFVFLTIDDVVRNLAEIQNAIDQPQAEVTFLIDATNKSESARDLHDLAALRLLAQTAVLSPSSPAELRQMLEWSLQQSGPAAIYLPATMPSADHALFSVRPASASSPIEYGRGELVSQGSDIALIAWGAMAEAAKAAADILAGDGIGVAVVSVRFAQPLDRDLILKAAQGALCSVILDRPSAGGGFSGAVLELLAEHGLASPISVLTPSLPKGRNNLPNRQSRRLNLIEKIVERCRWLAEPADELNTTARSVTTVRPADADRSRWISLLKPAFPRRYDEHQQVLAAQLNPTVAAWMETYLKAGRRNLYFWKWCVHGAELTTLPCVQPELRASVCETKVLSIMLCVLLDDVADRQDKAQLLEVLLAIIDRRTDVALDTLDAEDRNCALITQELTGIYYQRIAEYPRYAELADLLHYDQMQYFNTMRYSHLLNHHLSLLNVTEHDLYMPHAMHMMSFATLDLMCTPEFDMNELGRLREAVWHAQCMGRIGNLLSTWRREIGERDFNSGVFARALTAGDLTTAQLEAGDHDIIESAIVGGQHEQHFLAEWQQHRQALEQHIHQIHSVDLQSALEGQERFFQMHFDSRGLI